MKPLTQKYISKDQELKWQNFWENNNIYQWCSSTLKENNYIIDTPPPTVSGMLHMGHVFSYTQADFIARFQRMSGKNVFYPMGFDDNGLPTERLVEKTKKIRAVDLPRKEFIDICNQISKDARNDFKALFKSIALSVDWNLEYHTISEKSRKLSQMSFLDLYNKKHIYKKLQPMLWDPIDCTAIAQAEIEEQEEASKMNYVVFKSSDYKNTSEEESTNFDASNLIDEDIIIATTRPELLPSCVSIFYHPEDQRFKHFEGKYTITPLFGVKVPLIPSSDVKMDKGSGVVMCCTFGDEQDIRWQETHDLSIRQIIKKNGRITNFSKNADSISFDLETDSFTNNGISSKECLSLQKCYESLNYIENKKVTSKNTNNPGARESILELLAKKNYLEKQEEISHTVKCAERSGAKLEIIPTAQWFIKITDKKEILKELADKCNWHPKFMKNRIDQWIDGLNWDWCISRQRYFGVPFPVWYSKRSGEEGKILIANKNSLPVDPMADLPQGYTKDEVVAETDVMDTWATSSLSPQLSSSAITDDYSIDYDIHQKIFPTNLRPQSHEIIRTWAFYTIVKSYLHEGITPWKDILISGWCLASDKTKMSKSKGNIITPVALIEEKGADVVRYWSSTSHPGVDTAYSEESLKIGKKLVTKLWNASKFVSIHIEKIQSIFKEEPTTATDDVNKGLITEILDLWILTKLRYTVKKATEEFNNYQYCNARKSVEDFFWNDFCDNYLEIIKVRAYGESEEITTSEQKSSIFTIYHCLETVLRLFAPFIPHITEELYSCVFESKSKTYDSCSIHSKGTWPKEQNYPISKDSENHGILFVLILDFTRKMKADFNVSLKWPLKFISIESKIISSKTNKGFLKDLRNVTNSNNIIFGKKEFIENRGSSYTSDEHNMTINIELLEENKEGKKLSL